MRQRLFLRLSNLFQVGPNILSFDLWDFGFAAGLDYKATVSFTPVLQVDIDIKPGDDSNCFNKDGHGVIPVAILGSADFDATQVDAATVALKGLAVKAVGKSDKLLAHIEDVNNDGHDDMVVQIEDQDETFQVGEATATLTGNLLDGTPIEGTDSICIVS